MSRLDRIAERLSRTAANRLSRRSFFARLGGGAAAASFPLLPVSRANGQTQQPGETGDVESCDYWRYCAIDGYLCSCCGGSTSTCPPGTEPSPITWVGTCRNPVDGKDYVISYNDCCGKSGCGRCLCNRNERDTPIYQPQSSNDINWCLGTQIGTVYNCSTSVVLGPAG
ncbi:MAG TPA: methylamine dehydrogenase light chain [Phenylobacterium sp.]|uniref:methylamine dehydrogenase light chain n=1 Tax=Phenylobacterium sp. TaxID=1871053 RepID=UPI002B4765D1|nr:methylamine dehydrogenase light chain [Phenylobacterium sp.]HKR86841.1 methylamine dehydrogenase light chain [Phenylobacterium sp.]